VLDCTPDHQPYLGPVPGVPGLCVAAGFSGHGFKLAPVIGEMVASAITGAATAFDIELFSPYRLHEQRPIRSEHVYAVSAPV
jgi:glycine/D-amino acid oxidase-like deaminating enzyme